MPIDLGQVDWLYVAVLAVFAFVATGVANLLSFNHGGSPPCWRRCCSRQYSYSGPIARTACHFRHR